MKANFLDTPIIDYPLHPAFKDLAPALRNIDQDFKVICESIQKELVQLESSLESLSDEVIHAEYIKKIVPLIDSLKEKSLKSSELDKETISRCEKILNYSKGFIWEQIFIHARKVKNRNTTKNELISNGIQIFKFRQEELKGFDLTAFKEESEFLLEKNRNLVRCSDLPLSYHAPQFKAVEKFLKKKGIVKIVSDYLNTPCRVNYAVLIYNSDQEIWYKDAYADVGLKDSTTVYYHYDYCPKNIKCIFYLSEVKAESGPFKFVPNTYKDGLGSIYHMFHKSVDQMLWDELANRESKYYRKIFTPFFRKNFIKLPLPLRGTSHFGDDVLEGSSLEKSLLENERMVLTSEGNAFLFDGSHLLHRGGQVETGSRWAVQVGISPKEKFSQEAMRSIKRFIRTIIKPKKDVWVVASKK